MLREVDRQDHLVATNGTVLLAVELRSLACVQLEAQDGRSVPRLLYLAAVQVSAGDSARGSQRRRFLQTATAQVGPWPVACGDSRGIDRPRRCIPRMSHAARIGLRSWTISLGLGPMGRSQGADQQVRGSVSTRDYSLVPCLIAR